MNAEISSKDLANALLQVIKNQGKIKSQYVESCEILEGLGHLELVEIDYNIGRLYSITESGVDFITDVLNSLPHSNNR